MFYEYALDPKVLSSWERVRYLLESFGPWTGRFLVKLPKKWKKAVHQVVASSHCGEVERLRVVERLNQLDNAVFSPRPGVVVPDPAPPWIESAEVEHARMPMRAIITEGASTKSHVLDAATLSADAVLWQIEQGVTVARDPRDIATALSLLIAASDRVVLIDPYFRADQSDKATMLRALCAPLRGRTATVDVHVSEKDLAWSDSRRHALRALPAMLPRGLQLTLHGWRERPGGHRFHNRYLLTNIGGVQFGDSIEQGGPGEDDRLTRMGRPERAKYFDRFHGAEPAFDRVGEAVVIIGEGG